MACRVIHRHTRELILDWPEPTLEFARLEDRPLDEADLAHRRLRGASLQRSSLCRADLRAADLCHADLSGTGLRGADLTRARIHGAFFCAADLRGARLDRVAASVAWYCADTRGIVPEEGRWWHPAAFPAAAALAELARYARQIDARLTLDHYHDVPYYTIAPARRRARAQIWVLPDGLHLVAHPRRGLLSRSPGPVTEQRIDPHATWPEVRAALDAFLT